MRNKEKRERIWAEIALDSITENYNLIKQALPADTQMMAVVKADGYGHGALPVAKQLQGLTYIWGFGVATIEEASLLRDGDITKPILILGNVFEDDYSILLERDLRPTIFTVAMAEKLSALALKMKKRLAVHIKVDTGMTRLGFADDEKGFADIQNISQMSGIYLEGLFTHLACADEQDKSSAKEQLRRYELFKEQLANKGLLFPIAHTANSAAAMELPAACYDMVRIGIAGYGVYPSPAVLRTKIPIRPALALKSHVIFIKEVKAGTPISYGATYITPSDKKVATIPVGYADGYPRSLSSCGSVLIRGKQAPILGRICMDQMMVDVTNIVDARELDEVILLGGEITIEELSELSGKFPYEFICGIGKRVPRRYI